MNNYLECLTIIRILMVKMTTGKSMLEKEKEEERTVRKE